MSATVSPGGAGEDGYENVEVALLLLPDEKEELAGWLDAHGWIYEAEALRGGES